jgi:hypothetical protein
MFSKRFFSASLGAFFSALAVHAAHGETRAAPDNNPFNLQGEAAVQAMGGQMGSLAARHGQSADSMARLLRQDSSLRLDGDGRLFVVETPPNQELLQGRRAGPDGRSATTPFPLSRTFKLHSRPTAKRTIFLNFKGATLTNNAWVGSNVVQAVPFDTDGSPNIFSPSERTTIQFVWQRVAEDFAPFDVDVTTEPPLPERLTRSSPADDEYGTTALITNNAGVYNCGCGGVAYIGVFDDVGDYYKPALVFFNMLGSDEKNIAEATSHEVGHNLNLLHDGYSGGGYYPGHGSGNTGWAPIMGVGYYQPVVQWSKGEYATANNQQDDLLVMQNAGLPLRPDDHGNTTDTATALRRSVSGTTVTLSGEGVIERTGDQDLFRFKAGAGELSINLRPDSRSPNVDLLLQLVDFRGNVVGTSNPKQSLGVTFKFTVPVTAPYFLVVTNTGYSDPLIDGYSAYGSLGQYTVSGTTTAAP